MRSAALLLLIVAACAKPAPPTYACDTTGRYVITGDMPDAVALELINRNIALTSLRIRALSGEKFIDQTKLVKATGCP